MYFVKLLEVLYGMMSMKNHLKGVLGFSGILNIGFLLIVYILHDAHKGSGSTMGSISCQIFVLSPSNRILWVYVLISSVIILEKFSSWEFAFLFWHSFCLYQKCVFSFCIFCYLNRVLLVISEEKRAKYFEKNSCMSRIHWRNNRT